jgi:EF hand domain-containing protein
MRYLLTSFAAAAASLLSISIMAAEPGAKDANQDESAVRSEIREKLVKEFDKNDDGKLSDDERQEARQKMRELMEQRHRQRGDDGERGEHRRHDHGKDRDGHDRDGHGPEGHGPDAHHDGRDGHDAGSPKMPKPEEMFSKFDKDGDGKLSKEEFMALAEYVHEHMPPPPERPGFANRGPGPDGPPRGHFEGHFEGRLEGRFVEGNIGPDGPPRFRDGEGPGRRFRRPDGPPRDRDGDDENEMRRHDGPPGDGPGRQGDRTPRGRRSMERAGRRGPPPGDRDDDDDRRPPRRDRSDDGQIDKDKATTAT